MYYTDKVNKEICFIFMLLLFFFFYKDVIHVHIDSTPEAQVLKAKDTPVSKSPLKKVF